MGIESDRFVYGVPQDAHCFLCCLVLEDPVEITECGHFFCNGCLEDWKKNSCEEQSTCPYCGFLIGQSSSRKSKLLWNLIQNMNVYCTYKNDGCETTYKYGFEDLHRETCIHERQRKDNNNQNGVKIDKCLTCKINLEENINSHDCMKELINRVKEQSALLTNLEHENNRLLFKLSTCEKQFLEERTELEGQFYLESLRCNKEIRELRTRLAQYQGGMVLQSGKIDQKDIDINLERLNGTLGFNIIGGASKNGDTNGIFVSRIAEGGAADQPGKLMLHDRILEVDGVDLREASHETAVNAFRASGDPVKMVVRRQVCMTRSADAGTQTQPVYEPHDDVFEANPKRKGWFDPMAMSVSTDFSSNEVKTDYDSAYDTLNKSSRHSIQSPSMADQSDRESTNTEATIAADADSSFKESVSETDNSEKRRSTYMVLPAKEEEFSSPEHTADADAEFEYEYEEVLLRKRGGKFGVLLCYGGNGGHEADVSVYVGDVEENSDADVSGKIMVGDQIVQINGCQVVNVDQAYQMFEKNDVITLVVARTMYDNQTDYYDEPETDLDCVLDCIAEESDDIQSKTSTPTYASSISSKSSDNLKNSPEHVTSPVKCNDSKPLSPSSSSSSKSREDTLQRELTSSTTTATTVQSHSEVKRHDSSSSTHKNEKETKTRNSLKNFMKNKLGGQKDKRTGSHSDDSLDFTKLPRCDSNSSTNSNKSQKSKESHNVSNSRNSDELLKARLKEQRQQSKLKAYLDSPSLNRHKTSPHVSLFQAPYMINSGPQIPMVYHGVANMAPVFAHRPPQLTPTPPYNNSLGNRNGMTASVSSLRSALKNSQMNNGKPQTNNTKPTTKRVSIDPHQGWNDTERRVWEEFKIIQSMERENGENKIDGDVAMANIEAEWRVRRSKDGKHVYIKKTNSSRNKILKERAQQINDERCGVTTDDDAFTIYQGQYWSRDQRKKQLTRHNERRKRLVQKAEIKANYENKTEKEMAEMVQRKMTLPVFDNFITIEEILSQRNRSGVFAGPIHVTTI